MLPGLCPPYAGPHGTLRACLLPLNGGPVIEIVQPLTILGRRDGCDVRLADTCVSKAHCALVWANGLLLLRDLFSRNGTRVNGARVHEVALDNDDQIDIAGYRFVVRFQAEADRPGENVDPTYRLN
jgi:pSer/pThr/pTyr-binding forkhead associated (FHA) protein